MTKRTVVWRWSRLIVAAAGVTGAPALGPQQALGASAQIERTTSFPLQRAAYARILDLAVAPDGNTWIVGTTDRADFPVTADAHDKTFGPLIDVFLAKVTPGGTLAYATFLGGDVGLAGDEERHGGVAIDSDGNIYVVGTTDSDNFPIVGAAFQNQLNRGQQTGTRDVFLAKFDSTGALVYSTFIGGRFDELGVHLPYSEVAVDAAGNIFVVGQTASDDFPVVNALRPTLNDGQGVVRYDAFVVKFNAALQVEYATYLGGPELDYGWRVAGDGTGAAYVFGYSAGSFPVTPGAFQATPPVGAERSNTWLAKLSADGSRLEYATYISSFVEGGYPDLAVDTAGHAFVSGQVFFGDVPVTPGAFQTTRPGQTDMFLMKLNPSGSGLVYSTYLGGTGPDLTVGGLAVDTTGTAYLTAEVGSANFPFVNTFAERQSGGTLIKVNPQGSALVYASGLGPNFGLASAVALGPDGEVAVGGTWLSAPSQYNDAVVLRIVESTGRDCAGDCSGDGETTINEVITGVNIALDNAAVAVCSVFDRNGDGSVSVDEIIRAVNAVLLGCG